MRVKCIGNRSAEVSKIKDTIIITLFWKDKRLAGLQFTKEEALKLVGELNGFIRPNTGTK